jgi:hypothetical protein
MAMCSVIAQVHRQQPQVSHEGLKDGCIGLVRLAAVRIYHRHLLHNFGSEPLTLATAIWHFSDETSVIPVACFPIRNQLFHQAKQWPFDHPFAIEQCR